ncbi:ABC transporter permease [Methanobacterium alkalithermotolerans]|uniref:ABC transporter permease n=1 Tax=Methanobacterium alkalithermotolerans TaxID=2731220 RepID=A0A8T8K5J5_9EURY|nr:ABC transporter permease [Methanobacterium alkalithermotolerans]QUH23868.1 ABC transporter permease [Methanobacterium alkalithermotolerans]
MKFISIAIKDFKELIRDQRGLFMILGFPLFFMLVFGFAFGGMGQENEPHLLAVVNYDQGAIFPLTNEEVNFGNNFTEVLQDSKYEDSDVNLFNVTVTTEFEADRLIKSREVDAAIIIPEDFSQSMVQLINSNLNQQNIMVIPEGTTNSSNNFTSVIIKGDTSFSNFGVSQAILVGTLQQFQEETVSAISETISPSTAPSAESITTSVESVPGTESFSMFDFLAPGMMVFAILLLATTVAAALSREVETGTLARLKMSRMRSFDLLFGGLIPWSLVAAAQIVILLVVAIIMGFKWQGGLNSLILAIFIAVIGGIASVALGMIIAAFAKNDRQAANLGTLVTVPVSFLSGAFFALPPVVIGDFLGQQVQIYDLLPWTHTLTALRAVLTFGEGLNDITYSLGWMIVLTLILFVIGVGIFSRTRLSAEN